MATNTDRQSFWEHLNVLRAAIVKSLLVAVVFGIVAFCFKEQFFAVILTPKEADFITYRLLNANKSCITPYYLSKITFRILGMSPKEIIDRQIVMEMKRMLISTDLSVKEIADRFHFDGTSYMGRYFRRHTSMTPTEFRAQ